MVEHVLGDASSHGLQDVNRELRKAFLKYKESSRHDAGRAWQGAETLTRQLEGFDVSGRCLSSTVMLSSARP